MPDTHASTETEPALRRVRVLQLCAVDFTVRQFIAPLALALEEAGYDVRCACTKGPHWDELKEMGVEMVEMPIARSANPLRAWKSAWQLFRFLVKDRPDVLHVHTPVASMIGRAAAWLAGVPTIIYTAHGFYFHDRMPLRKRVVHTALERIFGLFNDWLFCVSKEDAETARRLRIAGHGHVFYVGNGASPTRFDPEKLAPSRARIREEVGIPQDATVITIMGRLVREKGYLEFFQAAQDIAAAHPNVHFLVAGDTVVSEHDSAKDEIVAAAKATVLHNRVHFVGMRSDVPDVLAACDIFCLPSWREGMPVSILEAMMMGLPVVATKIRGCREEVVDGATGFLVDVKAPDDLAGAMGYLVAHPEKARELGAAGRERALKKFDERKILRHQVRLYQKLVGGPKQP